MSSHNNLAIAESAGVSLEAPNDIPNPQEESYEEDHPSKVSHSPSGLKRRTKRKGNQKSASPKPSDGHKAKEELKETSRPHSKTTPDFQLLTLLFIERQPSVQE